MWRTEGGSKCGLYNKKPVHKRDAGSTAVTGGLEGTVMPTGLNSQLWLEEVGGGVGRQCAR